MADIHYTTSYNTYNDPRFNKLSEKISKIQNLEFKQPSQCSQIENRADFLDSNLSKSVKEFEFKYKFLQDELTYLNKVIEDNKQNKEFLKTKLQLELNNLEKKIKNLFEAERENLKNFTSGLISNLEKELIKLNEKMNREKEEIISAVQAVKEYIGVDLPKLNKQIEGSSEDRDNQIKDVVISMNDEFKYFYSLVLYFLIKYFIFKMN
jgi:hypothetical protein